jgi:probable phosphoglycerate mutase
MLTHQVLVLCMRYLLENLTEEQILAIDREGDVANCAITEYRFDPAAGTDGGLALERYNFTATLEDAGAPVAVLTDIKVPAR